MIAYAILFPADFDIVSSASQSSSCRGNCIASKGGGRKLGNAFGAWVFHPECSDCILSGSISLIPPPSHHSKLYG